MPAPGRVKEWRLRRRCRLSVAPRFLWECLTSSTLSWLPSPAASNRTCGSPASGVPTTFGLRPSRARATSPWQIAGLDSTGPEPRLEVGHGHVALPARAFPGHPALPDIPIQGLELLGRVTKAELVAPPPDDRMKFRHHGQHGTPQPTSFRLGPDLVAHGLHGFLARPPERNEPP
jgi:hypothetical protein